MEKFLIKINFPKMTVWEHGIDLCAGVSIVPAYASSPLDAICKVISSCGWFANWAEIVTELDYVQHYGSLPFWYMYK